MGIIRSLPDRAAAVRRWLRAGLHHLAEGEEGQSLVEYGLIVILIAIVVLSIVMVLGHNLSNTFSNVSNALNH